ncbi:MAG: 3-phosphoshikimate 1-carboxyvinyltransferase, partial [Stackebrandtia sp.]
MTDTSAPAAVRWTAPRATAAVNAVVPLPGSKSMMSRALVLTAASVGASSVASPLIARDSALMVTGLQAMGTRIATAEDSLWTIRPRPLTGPATINCGLAGTVMRFLPPLAATATGRIGFDGDEYARQRPMTPLVRALTALGVRVEHGDGPGLPFTVAGIGRATGGEVTIDSSTSSQFVSGLLLSAPGYDRGMVVRHVGPPVPSAPHVRMTVDM